MKIALILSIYNRPELLELSLYSLSLQTRVPDEILLCDDGSDHDYLSELWPLCGIRSAFSFLEQPHDGFGKQKLLNRALQATSCDYLIFLDSDCVVPPDWIAVHERLAKPDQYVCGMYTSLTERENRLVSRGTLADGSIWKTIERSYVGEPHIFCGAGSACWRKDALAINGFDTRFGWCGADYNFGLRLEKLGLSWIHLSIYTRYFHLWHEKPWAEDKTDFRAGNRTLANKMARQWAEESAVTPCGIFSWD